jgi:3-isopropylmalate dehydrogenase
VLDIIEASKNVKFEREFDLCGGCSLDKHGIASTEEVLQKCVEADAVFFGSAGGPEWGTKQPNPESGLLRVRERMQVSENCVCVCVLRGCSQLVFCLALVGWKCYDRMGVC